MAFAGFKKQLNKANQYMTEKIGGAEGTKLDEDFVEMERRTDVTNELVEELQLKTKEFLQPNPTARAKMAAVKGISKLSGQAKASTYPQPEGILGDCLLLYGKKLGENSVFGQALSEFGESLKQMADAKYCLDDNAKQNFLEPLHYLQMKDLKEVMHHRRKLQSRRLDFDCKRRKQAKGSHFTDEEVRQAEEKFEETLQSTHLAMFNLLENDVEQVSQLTAFAEALLDYHQQCTEIMKYAVRMLEQKRDEAANKPKRPFVPKTLMDVHLATNAATEMQSSGGATAESPQMNDARSSPSPVAGTPLTAPPAAAANIKEPCCVALYDFEPENPTELRFREGNIIRLISRIDENWFEGFLAGRTGYFPVTYVDVIVPLPS